MSVKDFNFIIVAILGFIATLLLLVRVDRFLQLKAIDDCARMATVRWTDANGAVITEPFQPVYTKCLKDKGINQ